MPDIRRLLQGRLLIIVVGMLALALSAAMALAMSRGVGDAELGEVEAGFSTATDFTMLTFDGEPITLSDFADGPVFIYFWASWCAPCYREAPLIERLWPEYRDAGYTFIGVNMLDGELDARAFIEAFDLTFPAVIDENDVYLEYGVYGLPEAFFLKSGLIVSRKFIGELTEPEFRKMLAELVELVE